MPGNEEPKKDPLVELLSTLLGKGPEGMPNAVPLWGYLVDSSQLPARDANGNKFTDLRLYFDLEFTEYIEFDPKEHYVDTPVDVNKMPLAGSIVWINRAARVRYVRIMGVQQVANFMSGDITEQFSSQAIGGAPDLPRRRRRNSMGRPDDSFGGCGSNAVQPICPG
jgi:hypothetical protein